MTAKEINLLSFLKSPKQFVIPIYQRTYSWTIQQCEQLWKDVIRAATDETVSGHFVGSIVYVEKGLYQVASVPQLLVIDGQQRLTTISLLLAAYGEALGREGVETEITQKKVFNYFLLNSEEDGDLRYKLLLTQSDRATLIRILDGIDPPDPCSKRIWENRAFFVDQLAREEVPLVTLYRGLAKLLIVDISLDREHDNPQLIFESLNSTGLELSQADLIRNFILMGLEPKEQDALYEMHWFPMEQGFGRDDYAARFDQFMRDYLTVKTGRIPNIREVYGAFKTFAQGGKSGSIPQIVADIHRYSKLFVRIALEKEDDGALRRHLEDLNTLRVDVAYPFLMEVYDDYVRGVIGRDAVAEILKYLESYVFRRSVCGIPTNALNKTFAALSREIDKSDYLNSFKAALILKDSSQRFPGDAEFDREFVVKDIYNFRSRNYLLRKIENHDRKERVSVEGWTIEHIMPQNENLSPSWRKGLGADWQAVHSRYLHTIGNLTLTGYNPELSDRPFSEKRDMRGGFSESPIRLNKDLAGLEHWGEEQMRERASRLAKVACEVWPIPTLPTDILAKYRKPDRSAKAHAYVLDDHPNLTGTVLVLFEQIRERILMLDSSITEKILKGYIAYKLSTNFVDIVPLKKSICLLLNMEYPSIQDPKGLCKNVTGKGHWGNGDVMVKIHSPEQLNDAMELVRQSFNKQAREA